MNIQLSSGTISVSAPLLQTRLNAALKTILRTIDGRFQSIHTEIPQVRRGFGVAAALADLSVGTGDHLNRVKRDISAAQREIEGEIIRAKSIIAQADAYTDLLASIAEHIQHGLPIRHESVAADLAEAGKLMRRSFLLGDADGLARKTADGLRAESEEAAGSIATAADASRKLIAAIKVGMFKQKAETFERLKSSADAALAIVSDAEKRAIGNAASIETVHYNGYRNGYVKTFLTKGVYVRFPNLKSLQRLQGRIVRTAKGIRITPPEAI